MIRTDRLLLRRLGDTDRAAFAAMLADPRVMDPPMSFHESGDLLDQLAALWDADGFCYGAIERRADACFLGMAGLAWTLPDAPLCPFFELGWSLAPAHWGQGYATEAARAWIEHGFGALALPEIVAFADPANHRSRAVLARIGLRPDGRRDPGPDDGQLRFTLTHADWRAGA